MSMQTKEQSMGYILKSMFDAGEKANFLTDYFGVLSEAIDQQTEHNPSYKIIDNYVTNDFMLFTNKELGKDDMDIQRIAAFLHDAFDIYTVEEAEDFYQAFKVILRIR